MEGWTAAGTLLTTAKMPWFPCADATHLEPIPTGRLDFVLHWCASSRAMKMQRLYFIGRFGRAGMMGMGMGMGMPSPICVGFSPFPACVSTCYV